MATNHYNSSIVIPI